MLKKSIVISLLFLTAKIAGQACCTAGTPLLGSLEMSTGAKGVWQFGLTYEYNSLRDVYAGSDRLDDQTRERLTQSVLMEINYGISHKFTVTALLSFVNQSRINDPLTGISNELVARGIGDALVMLKYNLISLDLIENRELSFGAGVKAPLGQSDVKSNGILIPADMQPGTGSWDGLLWGYYSQKLIDIIAINLFVNASYRINGTNKRFGADNAGYRFGNEFISSVGIGYRTDSILDFTLFARYRNTIPDKFAGQDISNTGGDWLYLVPGINIKLIDNLTARLTGQIPVYRKLLGTQLTTTFTTAVSMFYSFGGSSFEL